MGKRWSRQIERSRPEYRWTLLKASVVFSVLLLLQFALVHQLVSQDLTRKHMVDTLMTYGADAERVAERLEAILKEEGEFNLFRVQEKVTTLTKRVSEDLARSIAFHHITITDQYGRVVHNINNRVRSELRRDDTSPKLAEGDPEAPVTEVFRPVTSTLRGAGRLSVAQIQPLQPGQEVIYDHPQPPQTIKLDTQTREHVLVKPVGSGGSQPLGRVEVGFTQELLETEVAQLRGDLLKKLAAGAFLSLVLLIVGFLYVLKLLQKTRRLEAEAQMADRLGYIGTLASGLAHEIRNPLNAMNMNLQMLDEELAACLQSVSETQGDSEKEKEARMLLESTSGEIRRLERLVSNFLAYARPSALNREERDLNRALEDIVVFLRADFAAKGVELVPRLAERLPHVELDEAQFKQAVMNILVNARQVLGPGGVIEIKSSPVGEGEVRVRIQDNGPGIPPEKLQKIFEVFYSNRRGGTGLGLPIAQRIVEDHGGRIEVESESGRGTTFLITLPRRHRVEPAVAPAAEPVRSA